MELLCLEGKLNQNQRIKKLAPGLEIMTTPLVLYKNQELVTTGRLNHLYQFKEPVSRRSTVTPKKARNVDGTFVFIVNNAEYRQVMYPWCMKTMMT